MNHVLGLDHVQVAIPRGEEERARTFYSGLLGLEEIPKPGATARRGGSSARAPLRRLKALALSLLATLTAMCNSRAAESAPEALLKKLMSLAGSNSQDCGTVAQPDGRDAAVGCATRAAASGSAYRFAVQLQSAESSIWQGAARDARGRLWVVFYDSNRSDGPAAGPTLSVLQCREIVFALRSNDDLECKPFTGDP